MENILDMLGSLPQKRAPLWGALPVPPIEPKDEGDSQPTQQPGAEVGDIIKLLQSPSPVRPPGQVRYTHESPGWGGRHPGWANFLTGLMGGFESQVAPEAYKIQKSQEQQQYEQALESAREQRQQVLQILLHQWDANQRKDDIGLQAAIRGDNPATVVPKGTPGAVQVGSMFLQPYQEPKGTPIPQDSRMARAYKAVYGQEIPVGYDTIQAKRDPLLAQGFKYVEDQEGRKDMEEHLAASGKGFMGMIQSSALPDTLKKSYLDEWNNAATLDAKSKVTTQTDQIWNRARQDVAKYDPGMVKLADEAKRKADEESIRLAARRAAAETNARLEEEGRYGMAKVDPEIVAHAIANVKNSGGDGTVLASILRMYPRMPGEAGQVNAAYQRAISDGLAKSGVNVTHIANRTLEAGQLSVANLEHTNRLLGMLDDPKFQKKLGPVVGRWNEIMTGKVGKGDPDFNLLRSYAQMNNSAVALIHMGQRGAGSASGMEYFKKMADAGKMDYQTLRAGVQALKDWMMTYAGMIGPNSPLMDMGRLAGNNFDTTSPGFNYKPTEGDALKAGEEPDFVIKDGKVVANPLKEIKNGGKK